VRIVLIALVAGVVAGCGGDDSERTSVVTAFYPLELAVERIAGDEIDVTNLTPPGVEPHDIELSARDVMTVADADLVVYLGAGFQPALERAIDSTGAKAVDALAGLPLRQGEEGHGHEGEAAEEPGPEESTVDPHIWLDPVLFQKAVGKIASALGDSEQAGPLLAELAKLDDDFRAGLATCEHRELVTSHAAFGYLAERYGLEQVAITGLSPEAEPTPGELSEVVHEVREHGATTIFFETLVSPRLAETVAREVGAKTAVLNPLEGLTRSQLDRGEDYFSVMRENLAALRQALGCR
jgi:zinc transport system substrate-binding protein